MSAATNARLRLFADILCELAYDQDPPSGYFESSLNEALLVHGMNRDELDALARELGFDWACQDRPDEPDEKGERCKACSGGFLQGEGSWLCCCAEGAKTNRGAELRYKASIGECYETGCAAGADVDGWCDAHSTQFKKYGTHHPVGPYGAKQ